MGLQGVIPIKQIKKWSSGAELREHCEHIISHAERYMPERVFEAKEVLNSLEEDS